MPKLLAIDDEPAILHAFRRVFDGPDVTLLTASNAREGMESLCRHKPDVVILDINLPDESGLSMYRRINQHDAKIPVVFITGQGTTDTAIEAIKGGALDYLFKPLDIDKLREAVSTAFEVRRSMNTTATPSADTTGLDIEETIVGRCEPMNEVYKFIGRVAAQDVPVLITGESGTGKELVARSIWRHSRRADKPFMAINCAAIPESLIESEFFGHEKGAFTGADRLHIGKFEQCAGGTLFLDEITEMTPASQATLLRVLQEHVLTRVGGHDLIPTDVRVIAATNHPETELVSGRHCRRDLYYRLSVSTVHLPPLRQRGQDINLLADYFTARYSDELGKQAVSIADDARAQLNQYHWPGNVRELQSVIKQALLNAIGPTLIQEFFPSTIRDMQNHSSPAQPVQTQGGADIAQWDGFISDQLIGGASNLHRDAMSILEKHLLHRVLKHTGGNQRQAAVVLGISRSTLRARLKLLDPA